MPVPIAELFVTVGADVTQAVNGINSLGQTIKRAGSQLQSAGGDLTKGITAPILGTVGAVALFGAQFENSFANVQKTVEATPEQFATLKQSLLDLSKTPEAGGLGANQLADIAAVGGQMGIAADGLAQFTKVAAQLSGNTGIAAQQVGEDMGIIATLTHTASDEFENMGSAITDLGNKLNGGERAIIEVAKRIAGAATSLGVSKQDIIGIAGAVGAIGVEPEAGGTAVQRLLLEMTSAIAGTGQATDEQKKKMQEYQDRLTDLGSSLQAAQDRQKAFGRNTAASAVTANAAQIEKYKREIGETQSEMANLQNTVSGGGGKLKAFADIAGVTSDEFKAMLKRNPTDALLAIIDGLNRISRGPSGKEGVVNALDAAGINDARLTRVLISLAEGSDEVHKAIGSSNTAWADNTALAEENRKKQSTVIQQLIRLKNTIETISIEAWPGFEGAARSAIDFISSKIIPALDELRNKWLALNPEQQRNILLFFGLAAAIGPALFALGLFVTVVGSLLNPIVLLAALIAFLAAAWIANFGGIREKVGSAIEFIVDLLQRDFGGALKVAVIAALVAAAIIGNAIGGLIVKFAGLATTFLLQAGRIALGWIIAAGPIALLVGGILLAITVLDLFRHAWDENLADIQGKAVAIAEVVKGLAQLRLAMAVTQEARAGATQDIQNIQDFIDRVKTSGNAAPQLQGIADALDKGEAALKQFDAGFPAAQQSIRDQLNQAIGGGLQTGALNALGIPDSNVANALTTATGNAPTIPAGLERAGAFTTTPTPIGPVSVTINNPTVLDRASIDAMFAQGVTALTDALITAEAATDAPPDIRLPGQPFFVPGA